MTTKENHSISMGYDIIKNFQIKGTDTQRIRIFHLSGQFLAVMSY